MPIKVNNLANYEPIDIRLSKTKTPIAYNNKLQELLEEGAFESKEEAEEWINDTQIEVEMYYEKGHGLFLVESEAVESSGPLCSPYSKEPFVDEDGAIRDIPSGEHEKVTLEKIMGDYGKSNTCMGDVLGKEMADGLTLEEAFYLYIKAHSQANGTKFTRMYGECEDSKIDLVRVAHDNFGKL